MQLLAETIRPPGGPAAIDVEVRDQALMGGIATLIARRLTPANRPAFPSFSPTSPRWFCALTRSPLLLLKNLHLYS